MTTKDILAQAMTSITGDALKNVIKKATTRLETPPKKKHIQTIIIYLKNPRAQCVHLVDIFSERVRKAYWIVAIKALLVLHLLINSGAEDFIRQLSLRISLFRLDGYIDNSSLRSAEMSRYVATYARFLDKKTASFREYKCDITSNPKEQFNPNLNNIERIFKEIALLMLMIEALNDNQIDFNQQSPLILNIQTYLFNEYLKVYAALNIRVVYFLQNLDELEAIEAVSVFDIYNKYIVVHKKITDIASLGARNNVEIAKNIQLLEPPTEITSWLSDYIKDIIRSRGSRRLQLKWGITPVEQKPALPAATEQWKVDLESIRFDPDPQFTSFNPLREDSLSSLNEMESYSMVTPRIECPPKLRAVTESDREKVISFQNPQRSTSDENYDSLIRANNFHNNHESHNPAAYRDPSTQIFSKPTHPANPPAQHPPQPESKKTDAFGFSSNFDDLSSLVWDTASIAQPSQSDRRVNETNPFS